MYIEKNISTMIKINNINDIYNIRENVYYYVEPYIFYGDFLYKKLTLPLQDVFYFSEEVKTNCLQFLQDNEKYISIHLRLGDKYLEIDKQYVHVKNDVRYYNESKIFELIEKMYDKKIVFFCDNHGYKVKIKNKYDKIVLTGYNIGHTSLSNTTDSQILDAVSEFFLLSNSEYIYACSYSGFSIMASKFKNTPISYLYEIGV
jgi:hypothetical protein